MKRALITGITGQDGAYLAEFLLEKGYEVHDPNMPYIASKGHGFRDSLSGNPRYLILLEKMHLPLTEE